MKLVAQLRIKNQVLTINECLNRLSNLVDNIVIVDNGSTDGTLEEYKKFPKIKKIKKTKGFDEGRDKCLAHKLAKSLDPDWILWVDGDEIFERVVKREDLDKYMRISSLDVVSFRLFHFWTSKKKYRVDGAWNRYTSFPQRQMWRNTPEAYFKNIPFHNGGIQGLKGKVITSPIRIKHYGYIDEKIIKEREKTYHALRNDPMAKKTPSYSTRNMVLRNWHESKFTILNNLIQQQQYFYWNTVRAFEQLQDRFKIKFS
jgi:glycosyltransferase involved in cell wall biosynthesis